MPVDRTRLFTLPGIHDLNKDQDEALALPMAGQHLIIGGPGTGKSVVTLLRARRLAQSDKTYRTLVYNHLLDHSNRHLFGTEQPFSAKTWESWFHGIFSYFFGHVPTHDPEESGGFRSIDWEAVEQMVQDVHENMIVDHSNRYLVIDEGQDMPPAFYRTLTQLGFENFYVAADGNQVMHVDRCSPPDAIRDCLSIEANDTVELKINYRNTRPIAVLGRHFNPNDPSSAPIAIPPHFSGALIPELWDYGKRDAPTLAEIIDRILQLSDRNPRKLIGIITPDNKVRTKFNDALHRATPRLDNDKPPIRTFASGQRDLPDFGKGGIMTINAQSCKGLEFDIVILADIDQHQPKHDPYALKARFFIMVTRAREQVILLRTSNICRIVDSLLPTDATTLVRKAQ